jgi:uncharacterized protein (TIRG00374 family)
MLVRTAQILAGIGLLVYLAYSIDLSTVINTFASAHTPSVSLALLLLLPNLSFQYLKWRVIVRRHDPSVQARDVLCSLFVGFSLGIVTPARIGEYGGRALSIKGPRASVLVGLTALDKYFSMVVTLLFGAAGLALFLQRTNTSGSGLLIAALVSAALILGITWLALLKPGLILRMMDKHKTRWKTVEHMHAMLEAISLFKRRDFALLFLLSVLFWITITAQFCALLAAFGTMDIFTAAVGTASVMVTKTIIPPVTLGELGIREGAAVFFLTRLGYAGAAAFNASLLLFAINLLIPGIIGLVFMGRLFPKRGGGV